MSKKISKVELQAFRAYEKKYEFDFSLSPDSTANLVVIYAPNGTGKTSFYDALEWTMSGEIQRISSNNRVREIANQEKGYILKNKDSDLSNGMVEITFSNQEYIKSTTKKIAGLRKTDYTKGKVVTNASKINLEKAKQFVGKNILTHDQIDRFLRFQNSKDRYEALRIFWDFDNDTDFYKELLTFAKEIQSQKYELKKRQEQIVLDLQKYKLDDKTIIEINNKIVEFNSIRSPKELKLKNISNEDFEESLDDYIAEKSKLEIGLREESNRINDLSKLLNVYKNEFREKRSKLKNINEVELPIALKKYNTLTKITEIEILKEKYLKNLSELNYKIKLLSYLYDHEEIYLEVESKRMNLIKRQSELISSRNEQLKNMTVVQHDTSEKKTIIEKHRKKLDEIQEKQLKIKKLRKYKEIDKEYNDLVFKLNNLNNKLKNKSNEVAYHNIKNENYLKILEMSKNKLFNSDNLLINQPDEEVSILENFRLKMSKYLELEKRISTKENELLKLNKLGDDIGILKKTGMDIIKKSKLSNCPLCNQQYNEFRILLDNIEVSGSQFYEVTSKSEELTQLNEQKTKLLEEINFIHGKINEQVRIEKEDNDKKLNKLLNQRASWEEEYKAVKIKKRIIEEEVEALKLLLKEFNVMDGEPEKIIAEINSFHNRYQSQAEKIKCELEKEVILLETSQSKLEYARSNIEIITNVIKQNEISIKQLNNNETYQTYKDHQITIGNINDNKTLETLKELQDQRNRLEQEIELVKNKISSLHLNIEEDKSEITTNLQELREEAGKLEFQLSKIKAEFANFFKVENVLESDIENEINKLSRDINFLKDQNTILNHIINILSGYVNNTIKTEKEEELRRIKSEIRKLNKHLKRVDNLKKDAHENIKKRIENVFNLNSVNKIFQMIDPHPQLVEIYFKLDESLKDGGLGLNIMCKDSSENEEGQAPILYLSSAQVNILSLSIFLASAIENTDDICSILMDDPVQHLDGLNILSFIDLIRIICFTLNKQVIISTHDQSFFNLCQRKIDPDYFPAKYFNLSPTRQSLLSQ